MWFESTTAVLLVHRTSYHYEERIMSMIPEDLQTHWAMLACIICEFVAKLLEFFLSRSLHLLMKTKSNYFVN